MAELLAGNFTNIVAFAPRLAAAGPAIHAACLTPRDRMELTELHDAARLAGYDRMVIHDRDDGDAAEVGNFLSVYKRGDAWSRWGFARRGGVIRAWCCLSGRDVGEFDSLREAVMSVLQGMPKTRCIAASIVPLETSARRPANVTELHPELARYRASIGSAA